MAVACDHDDLRARIAAGDLSDPRVEHWFATRERMGGNILGRCSCGALVEVASPRRQKNKRRPAA